MIDAARHIPVLRDEVVAALALSGGETVIDGTFGAGGYAQAILAAGAARVVAFDRDPDAIAEGRAMEAASSGRLTLIHDRFSRLVEVMAERDLGAVDGVVFDLGVSSMQLDRAERGFSFQGDGPADMRMDQEGVSAADFLNTAEEAEIADVIFRYGDEPKARRIARAIVAARPIERTGALAAVVRRAVGWRPDQSSDPATRTFQAIRIHLNRELEELELGLAAAERALAPGGRLAVVSFHSLEDRAVKRFLRDRSGQAPGGSRHLPVVTDRREPSFGDVVRPVRAATAEVARNPRARSATLRAATRTNAPAWEYQS